MSEEFSLDGKPCDLGYLEVNPTFERHTGLKAVDIVGRPVLELFPQAKPVWIQRSALDEPVMKPCDGTHETARAVAGLPPCPKEGVMWYPARETRRVMAFLLAAAVAFLGCVTLLKGRAFPALVGGAPGDGHPGILLLAVVILLATAGGLLLAMAGKELVDLLRHPRAR